MIKLKRLNHNFRSVNFMSINNDIRNLLDIQDKNILFFKNAVTTVTYHQRKIKKVNAVLTYIPKCCERCGIINTNFTVVKNGTKTSMILLPRTSHFDTYLNLKKQRFYCKACQETFTARTTVIEPGCHLSIAIKRLTLLYLSDISSIKTISKRVGISISTTLRVLNTLENQHQTDWMHLPEVLCFDEVRLTSNVLGGLSFIYLDEKSGKILDILPDRRQTTLKSHFLHYPKEVRDKVKYIVIDMNASYETVIKTVFPNAAIILDRFHIVQLFQRSLSSTRVNVSKQLSYKKDALVLKRYWKKFNKYSDKLDYKNYKHFSLFKGLFTEQDLMDRLLAYSPELSDAYDIYQAIIRIIKYKKTEEFLPFLEELEKKGTPNDLFKTSVQSIIKHKEHILNAISYSYSNATLEGINNKIKVIKRVSFGYRTFNSFRNRIFITA